VRTPLAVAVVALTLIAPAATSGASQARLTLVRTRPVSVQGAGFRAHERVALTLRSPRGDDRLTVRAARDGTFTVRFSADVDVYCTSFSVSASGGDGSRARFIRRQPVSCTRAA
jgi:hypothetical protein